MIDKLSELLRSTSVEKLTLTVELKGGGSVPVDPPVNPPVPPPVSDPPGPVGLSYEKLSESSCRLFWSNPMQYNYIYIKISANGNFIRDHWLENNSATSHVFDGLEKAHYRFEVIGVAHNWQGLPEAYGGADVYVDMR